MIGPLLGSVLTLLAAQPASPAAADIGPIIHSRCVPCHRAGGDAPFSLETIDDVRRRASMIVAVTKSRYMPPWKPVPGFGDFQHSRRLTDTEITTIEQWVASDRAGSLEHSSASLSRRSPEGAEADLTVSLPSYRLRAGGPDVFRNFVVPIPIRESRFVRAIQFRPGNRAVHHANIRIDVTPASRRLDEADPSAGYEGIIARSADFPDGQFLGWTPGQILPVLNDDNAWRLPAGADLVVQLHMRPTGAEEFIEPTIALYFGDRGPTNAPTMIRLGKQNLDIPGSTRAQAVTDTFELPVAVEALAIQAHAHSRARSVDAYATRPDGTRVPLLRINHWDVAWQDRYTYRQPVALPAGTRLTSTYVFNNESSDRVRWGWRSSDEMGDVWIQVRTSSESDRAALRAAITPKMLSEDAIGIDVLLKREPDHIALHNDAAQTYLALGKPLEAARHFAAVVKRQPNSAAAWFNEGSALEAAGRIADAMARYRQALTRDPDYAPALNNLGVAHMREGQVDVARNLFAAAADRDPMNADAQANLGLVLMAGRHPDLGLARVARALEIKPELLAGMMPHAWLLAANADAASRRPADALHLAQRIASISADRVGALDLLAACQAALGDFDRAVQTASAAVSAAPAPSAELRNAIQRRIALYKSRRPFTLAP